MALRIISLLLLLFATSAFATDWHPADGNSATIQAAIDNPSVVAGDRIFIPDSSGQPGGQWVWTPGPDGKTAVRVNRGFNIQLIGGDGTVGTRPVITGQSGLVRMLWYTAADPTPRKTGMIQNLEFLSDGNIDRLRVDGVSNYTVDPTTGAVTGGFRLTGCKFNNPFYDGPGRDITGCSTTAGSQTLTCTGGNFVLTDVKNGDTQGKGARVVWDGTFSSSPHAVFSMHTRLKTLVSPTQVTLNQPALTTTSGQTFHLTGITPNNSAAWLDWSGWVMGVIDHCILLENTIRVLSVHGDFANSTSPNGTGDLGDYAHQFLPSGKNEIGGNLEGIYFEDDIFVNGTSAITDCGSNAGTTTGGALFIMRHCTTEGSLATHGTRESGGTRLSARLMEYYNNHIFRPGAKTGFPDTSIMEQRDTTSALEDRDGEQINYNDYLTVQEGATSQIINLESNQRMNGGTDSCGAFTVSQSNGLYWGADGLNPLDLNQKGDFTFKGFAHKVYSLYNIQTSTGLDIMKGYDAAHGLDSSDVVQNGQDSDKRFGDVYGAVTTAGTYVPCVGSPAPAGCDNNKMTGVTINWTAATGLSSIPADYFKGFIFRNAGIRRGRAASQPAIAWKAITGNTAGTGPNGNANITLTFRASNPCGSDLPLTLANGPFEIRKINIYFGVVGRGNMSPGFSPLGVDPRRLPSDCGANNPVCDPGQNPYFTSFDTGGSYSFGNRRRQGMGPGGYDDWSNSLPEQPFVDTFQPDYIERSVMIIPGYATDIKSLAIHPSATPSPIQPLFTKGYYWDDTIAAGSDPATKVGANWGVAIDDPVTGEHILSTIGPESPAEITGATANTLSPEFRSFYRQGVGGFKYPHPLVQAPTAAAPAITSANSTSFTASVTPDCTANPKVNCFTVTANGPPTPQFTPAPTPKPAFLTATDNGDGTMTLSGNPTAGTGPFNFTITAHNTQAPDATQAFTLNVISPTGITLDNPQNGANFVLPATINLQATVTGTPGTVDFKNGNTLIGSDSTAPYSFAWSPAVGNYAVKACVGVQCSAVANITVTFAPPTPTPANISAQ